MYTPSHKEYHDMNILQAMTLSDFTRPEKRSVSGVLFDVSWKYVYMYIHICMCVFVYVFECVSVFLLQILVPSDEITSYNFVF